MTYEPTIHICDNLLTKHLTHMAHISKPQVRNVRILQIRRLDLFKFEILQTNFKKSIDFDIYFFASNIFSFYKPQVTSFI